MFSGKKKEFFMKTVTEMVLVFSNMKATICKQTCQWKWCHEVSSGSLKYLEMTGSVMAVVKQQDLNAIYEMCMVIIMGSRVKQLELLGS